MKQFNRTQTWKWVALATVVLLAGAWVLLFYRSPAWDFRNNPWGPAHLLLHGQHAYDSVGQALGDRGGNRSTPPSGSPLL